MQRRLHLRHVDKHKWHTIALSKVIEAPRLRELKQLDELPS